MFIILLLNILNYEYQKKIYNIISWPGRTFEKLDNYSQAKYQKGLSKRIARSYDLAKKKVSEQHKDSELNDEICIENKILIRDRRKFNYFDKFFQIESSDLDSQSKRRQSIHFLMQDLMQFPNHKREQYIADDLMGNLTQFLFDIKIYSLIEKKEIEESEFHEKALSNPISKGSGRPPQNGVAPANLLIIKYALIHKEYPRTKPSEMIGKNSIKN